MKAVVCEKPQQMVLKEVAKPAIGQDEVLIKVKATAICGSDLKSYQGVHPLVKLPKILGHEFTGIVAELGSSNSNFKVGDPVIVEPSFPCGKCYFCQRKQYYLCPSLKQIGHERDGAFAEYAVAHQNFIHKYPLELTWKKAAIIQPIAIALQAIKRSGVSKGDKILILGAGTIGLLIMMIAKQLGAVVGITDLVDFKLQKTKALGADYLFQGNDPHLQEQIQKQYGFPGPDIVFEAVGSSVTINQAFRLVRRGGRIILIGLTGHEWEQVPLEKIVLDELDVKGTVRYADGVYQEAIRLAAEGEIEVGSLINKTFTLEETVAVFADLYQDSSRMLRYVMLNEG